MLVNIVWLTPEIFLSGVTISLLGFGAIYSLLNKGEISQQKKITLLSVITLVFTAILEKVQYNWIISETCNEVIYLTKNNLYGLDSTIVGIKIVVLLSSAGILLMSLNEYVKRSRIITFEYTQLILLSTIGMLLLVSSKDLISLYLSIELVSLSLYILAAIQRDGQFSTEAGIKYFLLGAVASGILLLGSALIYWLTGETSFEGLSNFIWYSVYMPIEDNSLFLIKSAVLFIIIALLFKLAAAPFHMWAPDVYEGSPMIVTAYFAIVPKIATLGLLFELLFGPFASLFSSIEPFLVLSALLSIFIGSLGAINQTKLKRLVAYSAIAHIGFMLLGISTGVINGLFATFVYIGLYIVTSFNTFAFLLSCNSPIYISQLTGLSRFNPILAFTFAFSLFSMAGIPPLAGFFSKYLVILSVINNNSYFVALIAILLSVVGSFYYLRLIKWMFFTDNKDHIYKTLSDIALLSCGSVTSSNIPQEPISSTSNKVNLASLKINLINSIILGISLFILLTFLLFPNLLLNIVFESLTISLF